MEQYWKTYIEFGDEDWEVYNPQTSLYMTMRGMKGTRELDAVRDMSDPSFTEDFFKFFCGAKLIEHAWFGEPMVDGVVGRIEGRPAKVAWVGDYSDYDLRRAGFESIYERTWPDGIENDIPFPDVPERLDTGWIANHDRKVALNLKTWFERGRAVDERMDRAPYEFCIHPLPLLTAVGNEGAGGDYWQSYPPLKNQNRVGEWALETLSYHRRKPRGFEEIDYDAYMFDSSI